MRIRDGLLFVALSVAAAGPAAGAERWDKIVEAAKKEGKVVVSVPTSAELRKQVESGFRSRHPGIELELNAARGSANIHKILEEHKAGARTIDLHVGGTTSIITGLLANQILEPIPPALVLPEVSDEKKWWGGHIWADSAKKHIYTFTAYMTETIWYNTTLVKPEEIVSWDSLLDPKWKGKIAILDPRTPGSGESTFSFLWRVKGEPFLTKLAAQEMMVGRNLRQLAEAVARGKCALSVGVSYYTYLPFIKAGLPVTSVASVKEGYYASSGSGNVALLKNAPHPNAARVFVNWLLSKDGQTIFTKALGQPTRRLDVDTRWTREFGHTAAKEVLTPEKFDQLENGSEEVVLKYRKPAMQLAERLFR
ncbi:MAG TPA: extracellular solute-binding protein [candidate division Zixibacteria bacterium]|nr:extracellular solute-binding protein [candidate division Zixibacteria bacterium]